MGRFSEKCQCKKPQGCNEWVLSSCSNNLWQQWGCWGFTWEGGKPSSGCCSHSQLPPALCTSCCKSQCHGRLSDTQVILIVFSRPSLALLSSAQLQSESGQSSGLCSAWWEQLSSIPLQHQLRAASQGAWLSSQQAAGRNTHNKKSPQTALNLKSCKKPISKRPGCESVHTSTHCISSSHACSALIFPFGNLFRVELVGRISEENKRQCFEN